jgi:glycerophosphoryl diester phosphodiesterase
MPDPRFPVLDLSPPIVYAHRGGALVAPENTFEAFDRALDLGVDGFELDVRLSSDGVPMVIHDATLDRTTDAAGSVSARTAADLERADAGHWFGPETGYPCRGRGLRVPRLEEVLLRYTSVRVIVELKGASAPLALATIETIRRAGALDRVCLGGFSGRTMKAARSLEPRLPSGASRGEIRAALCSLRFGRALTPGAYQVFQVPEVSGGRRVVSPAFVQLAAGAGLPVYVWTVNERSDMERLLEWGVTGIITDRPDIAVEVREARRA